MKKNICWSIFFLMVGFSGCRTLKNAIRSYHENYKTKFKESNVLPLSILNDSSVQFHVKRTVHLYFYRPKTLIGSRVPVNVFINESPAFILKYGTVKDILAKSYSRLKILMQCGKQKNILWIKVLPGKNYYLKCLPKLNSCIDLPVVFESEPVAQNEIAKLLPSTKLK